MPRRQDRELADLIIAEDLLSAGEVEEALQALEEPEGSRRYRNLGEYLYATEKLSAEEIRRIFRSLCECVMRCRSCRRKFGVRRYDPERTYSCQHCGGEVEVLPTGNAVGNTEQSKDPYLGQTIAHFKLLARLGRGGTAAVYRALDLRLDRMLALKVLPGDKLDPNSATSARFMREARAIARVDHPAIVSVYDVGEVGDLRYIAMEYVDGESLRTRVNREGRLSVKDAARVTATVARALHAAHEAGIVHRDVKPGNILVGRGGTVHVTDFGLAKFCNDHRQITLAGSAIGTPAYMSPEQCRGKNVDRRSDIYSLGVTLWYLLTGEVPYEGTSLEVIQQHLVEQPVPDPRTIVPDLPESVCMVVEKMTNMNAGARYQDTLSLAEDLERVLGGEEPILPGIFEFLDDPGRDNEQKSVEIVISDVARKRRLQKEVERREKRKVAVQWIAWSGAAAVVCALVALYTIPDRKRDGVERDIVQASSGGGEVALPSIDDSLSHEFVVIEEELGRVTSLTGLARFYRKLEGLRWRHDDPAWAQRIGRLRQSTLSLMQRRFESVDEAAGFLADSGRVQDARKLYQDALKLPVESIRLAAQERLDALSAGPARPGQSGPYLGRLDSGSDRVIE